MLIHSELIDATRLIWCLGEWQNEFYGIIEQVSAKLVGKSIVYRRGKTQRVRVNVIAYHPDVHKLEVHNHTTRNVYMVALENIEIMKIDAIIKGA